MSDQSARFWYPFTASTVLARKLVPLLLFTLGIGLLLWAGREYYYWIRPWVILPAGALGVLCWWAAAYFFTLLPEVYADEKGLRVRRWGLSWWGIPWESVAGVQETARIDLLGWAESFYTVYRWQALAGRKGRIRREWHRRSVRGFRFSGHIRDSQRLLTLIEERRGSSHPADTAVGETSERSRRVPWVSMALFVGTLTVYVATLAPGVLGGDPGEYQFVPYILSMPHPTGTPLYILLSKLWSALPLGPSVAWRLNLLGAISASLAVVMVYQCVHLLAQRRVPALAAALTFAFGTTFWEQATMADKYAFNAFMVGLVLYLALRWGRTRSANTLYLLALTYGLSLTHHRTMVLFALPLLGYIWWYERGALWRDRRRLLRLAVLVLAPLLLYLYLPWAVARDLPPGMWHPRTLGDWIWAMYDEGWIREIRVIPEQQDQTMLLYGQTLLRDFTWVGLLLAIAGLVWQFSHTWPDALLLLVLFLVQGILAANYHVPRRWVFFLPSFVIFSLWIGQGLAWIWLYIEGLRRKWHQLDLAMATGLTLAMLALPLFLFIQTYEPFREAHLGAGVLDVWRQELKSGYMGERMGRAISTVDQEAVIVTDWEQSTPLWYYQQVEGWRPDVEIIYPFERFEEAVATGRPLYIARNHPDLTDRWHPSASGPLIALNPEPAVELPSDFSPLGVRLGEAFELAGFDYGEADYHPSTVVPLTLYWRAIDAPAHDYSVSLRLFDAAGQEVFKVDSQHPVLGTYPTSVWTAGEVVADYYEIQLPADLPPGSYHWGVILYRTLPDGGWENLKVAGTDSEVAIGGAFQVQER